MDDKVDDEPLLAGFKSEKVGPEKLLEDCWFFGNAKMSTTLSDPSQDHSYEEETYESIEKLSVSNPAASKGISHELGGRRRRRISQETSSNYILPASSPDDDDEEEEEEEEMEFSMGKLIRQASLNHSHTNPPKKQGLMTSSWMQELEKKSEVKSSELEKTSRPQDLMSQLKTQKSLGALQGCKDLGLIAFDSNPELQGRQKSGERKLTRTQSWAPPVPVKWGGKRSKDDIKTQIKFWARAVASNVNPES
ncbi:hypothetical protein ACS0TY_018630 [Phlomoides rotata]